jgi:hypothetical protein
MASDGWRRALVTGASSGIGAAFAERLAQAHSDLVLVARSGERLAALAERLQAAHGVRATVLAADLSQAADRDAVAAQIAADPEIDLLVNNAGFGTIGRFAALPVERELDEIAVNLVTVVRLTRAALPGMLARGHGGIINVSSMSAFQPGPYNATYAATKAYLNSFTLALSAELRGTGVRVQALCPGFTRTEFQAREGLDASRVPSFAWMSAEQVVDASLAALRRGRVVCVPGWANRFTAWLARVAPTPLVLALTERGGRRLLLDR